MILGPSERGSRRKADAVDAELDALVAREVDALSQRRAPPGAKRRVADKDATAAAMNEQRGSQTEASGAARAIRADAPGRGVEFRPHDNNVIGIRRAARSGRADVIPFSAEEEAFIEQSVAFLKGRENADVIIEEIWTHTVLDRHDGLDNARSDEALSPRELDELGTDALPGEPPLHPDGGGPSVNADHEVASIQSGRGKDRSIADTAGFSEAAPPRPAHRAALAQPSKPKSVDDPTLGGATE